jgi:hypothetical protein
VQLFGERLPSNENHDLPFLLDALLANKGLFSGTK